MDTQEQIQVDTILWGYQGFRVVGADIEESPSPKEPGRRILVVYLEDVRGYHRCPRCGKKHREARFQESAPRRFRETSQGDFETFVEITPMRVYCCRGMRVEAFPWEDPFGHRMTRRFTERIAALCRKCTTQSVAKMAGLAWYTVSKVDEESTRLALGGDRPRWDGLKWIGADEVSRNGGRVYFTIVTDLLRGRVVWVGERKGEKPLAEFFAELGEKACRKIRGVVCDLAAGYLKAIEASIPHATVVLDRFHIMKWTNDALKDIRRRIFGAAPKDALGRDLKAQQWLILSARENLRHGDKLRLHRLCQLNWPLYQAYLLKEQLRAILHHPWLYLGAMRRNLLAWSLAVHEAGHAELIKVAKRLINHMEKVEAGFTANVKLGFVEAINGKIAMIRRQSRGISNQDHFRFKIYQRCSLPNDPWANIVL
jgi:transposase